MFVGLDGAAVTELDHTWSLRMSCRYQIARFPDALKAPSPADTDVTVELSQHAFRSLILSVTPYRRRRRLHPDGRFIRLW